jgi:hypothetical protein
LILQDEKIAKQLDEEWNKSDSKCAGVEDEEVLTNLQSIEAESQENRDRQIQMDEELARQILDSDDNCKSTGKTAVLSKYLYVYESM